MTKIEEKGQLQLGQCKWFDSTKGYGFITLSSGDHGDIFVHQTQIKAKGFRSLAEGEELEFNVVTSDQDGRIKAVNVTGPKGAFVKGQPQKPTTVTPHRRRQLLGISSSKNRRKSKPKVTALGYSIPNVPYLPGDDEGYGGLGGFGGSYGCLDKNVEDGQQFDSCLVDNSTPGDSSRSVTPIVAHLVNSVPKQQSSAAHQQQAQTPTKRSKKWAKKKENEQSQQTQATEQAAEQPATEEAAPKPAGVEVACE